VPACSPYTAGYSGKRSGEPLHGWFTPDTKLLEQMMTGAVIGEMVGLLGNDRVRFKTLPRLRLR
jgi:hypothetical protein